ncbi:AAA family ATPase [Streptomyces sp. NPDC056549]|uniref:AAA family ATPase n=1 Tax=Streptomyces sp. NPDC056549 TaxID=3345864 RepID=UPI0036AAC8E2
MDNVRQMNRDTADHDGFTRVPPHNHDAELYVLGSCIHQPRHIPALRNLITGADFYRPAHELIWTVLGELFDAGQPTEPVALTRALEKRKDLNRAGGAAYVSTLANYSWPSPDYYAGFIREAADLRDAEELGRRISQYAYEPDAEPARVVTFIDDYLTRQKERTAGRSGDPADALLAELLDTSALDNMPTLEPLVGDLLHLDSLARIIGPSGHMKSFVVIDIAAHIGTGKPWHGHHVTQGTVVYLVAEGHRGIRKRVRAWEKHHGMKMDNVLFLPRPVQTRGPEWDTWIEAMRRLAPSLIVIDTQARVSVGVEENSNTELGLVIERLDDLRRATGACVLPIHHTGHIGEHGRGASAAKGALQSEFHVSKKGDNASNIIVTMKVGKQKDDEEGADLQFGLKVVTLDGETKPDGRPVTSVVLESLAPAGPAHNSPEWLVQILDRADIPLAWGSPRVIKWCAESDIQMRKSKIEEAVKIRKTRNTFDDPRNARNDLPPNLPRDLESPSPRDLGGTPGELKENPRSNIPPQTGGGPGDAPSKPPSPRSPSREGGGEGEDEKNTTPETPLCTVCNTPLHGYRLDRGYTTCLQHDAA